MNRRWIFAAAALLTLSLGTSPARADYLPQHIKMVDDWHCQYLGRNADRADIHRWCMKLAWHHPPGAVLTGILGSDEYYSKHGSCPAGFVTGLYADIRHRAPSQYELSYWTHRLHVRYGNRQRLAQEFIEISAFEDYVPPSRVPMLAPPGHPEMFQPPQMIVYP